MEFECKLADKSVQAILLVGCPAFRQAFEGPGHDTLKAQSALALEKARQGRVMLLPLLRKGTYHESFPESFRRYFIRDCRDDDNYTKVLAGLTTPPGIIPAVSRAFSVVAACCCMFICAVCCTCAGRDSGTRTPLAFGIRCHAVAVSMLQLRHCCRGCS